MGPERPKPGLIPAHSGSSACARVQTPGPRRGSRFRRRATRFLAKRSPERRQGTLRATEPPATGVCDRARAPHGGTGGEGGIRTLGRLPYTRFPSVRIRPLCHLSGGEPAQAPRGTPLRSKPARVAKAAEDGQRQSQAPTPPPVSVSSTSLRPPPPRESVHVLGFYLDARNNTNPARTPSLDSNAICANTHLLSIGCWRFV